MSYKSFLNTIQNEIFKLKIHDFSNYIEMMEENIESHKSSLEKSFEQQSKNITDDEIKQELYEHIFLDDYQALDTTYTLILRKSIFITLYSFLESELFKLAKYVEERSSAKKKLEDVKHNGIRKYLYYIETVNGIEINISKDSRDKLINYNKLRNHFVHNYDSLVDHDSYNKIKNLPYMNIKLYSYSDKEKDNMYEIISLDKDFNILYLELISTVVGNVYKALTTNQS